MVYRMLGTALENHKGQLGSHLDFSMCLRNNRPTNMPIPMVERVSRGVLLRRGACVTTASTSSPVLPSLITPPKGTVNLAGLRPRSLRIALLACRFCRNTQNHQSLAETNIAALLLLPTMPRRTQINADAVYIDMQSAAMVWPHGTYPTVLATRLCCVWIRELVFLPRAGLDFNSTYRS